MKLSVLDLLPARVGQSSTDALTAAKELVGTADRLGYTRYWVAEHHNMPAVASTSPPVILAALGQNTSSIRLGSGGVMLPNHAPLAVAEQFALLEALYPGRVDLGIGRAPGSDPVASMAMRGHVGIGGSIHDAQGNRVDPVERFPQYVSEVMALMSPGGVTLTMRSGQEYVLRSTPEATGVPDTWLLGSSGYSAQLAAALGLPYVFAHHFAGRGTETAMALYRNSFEPGEGGAEPRTFLTANVVVGETAEEAALLAEPYLYGISLLRSGRPLEAQRLVGADVRSRMTVTEREAMDQLADNAFIGTAETVAEQLTEFAARFEVDEVMIHPVAGGTEDDAPGSSAARVATLEALAPLLP